MLGGGQQKLPKVIHQRVIGPLVQLLEGISKGLIGAIDQTVGLLELAIILPLMLGC
jgi:hypothetical protein